MNQVSWLYERLGQDSGAPGPTDYRFYAVLPYGPGLPKGKYPTATLDPKVVHGFSEAGIDISMLMKNGEQVNVEQLVSPTLTPIFAAKWKDQLLIIMMSM